MTYKKITLLFTVIAASIATIVYLFYFRWVELPKIERRADGEGFIYQKIRDEDSLCYLTKTMTFGYDFYIKDDRIYIRYKDVLTLDDIDLLANLTSHAETLKAKSVCNKYGYYCTDFSDFYNTSM